MWNWTYRKKEGKENDHMRDVGPHSEGPTSLEPQSPCYLFYISLFIYWLNRIIYKRLSHWHNNFLNFSFQTFSTWYLRLLSRNIWNFIKIYFFFSFKWRMEVVNNNNNHLVLLSFLSIFFKNSFVSITTIWELIDMSFVLRTINNLHFCFN